MNYIFMSNHKRTQKQKMKMRTLSLLILYVTTSFFTACNKRPDNTIASVVQDPRLTNYLEACQTNGFNGSVLIVRNDSIILNKGFGLANMEDTVPNTPETVFDICSVTKQFTGATILKLEEEEKLKVTDSLGQYFKNIPSDKSGITIHQLLTHSAGFDHGIGGDFDHIPQDDYFKELFDGQLLFKPGTKYSYSNSGYSILGRIIEIVSGKSYEAYLREKLFNPSGMQETGYLLPKWNKKRIANEYVYNVLEKGNHIEKYQQDGKIAWPLKANGGINSTQNDMYKWYLALKDHKVLSKSSMEKLTTPYIAEDEEGFSHYAYGWATFQSSRNTKVVTHNGFNGVSYYEFVWFPEEDALILFATNSYTREVSVIPSRLEKMLFDPNYIPKTISKSGVGQLLTFSENYVGDEIQFGEEIRLNYPDLLNSPVALNRLSGIYMREKKVDKALAIAQINTQLFPEDGNMWDTMGDIYYTNDQKQKAIDSYKKALELKPDNDDCFWCENSENRLRQLTTN